MAIFSIGRRTTDTTNTDACFDVAASSAARPALMELGIALAAATPSTFGLNRPTAIGTRTAPVALLAEDPTHPAISDVDSALAHSVQPTFASEYLRRIGLPGTIGAGVIWTFPKGLIIDLSKSIALRNLGTNGVSDIYAVVDR